MKTKVNGNTYLWHLKGENENGDLIFQRLSPLGNNGEYLEMSTSENMKPLIETTKAVEDNKTSDLKSQSAQEDSVEESSTPTIDETEEAKKLTEITNLIMLQNPKLDKEGATKLFERAKDNKKMFAPFFQNVFKHKELQLNIEETIKELEKYC